MEYSWVKFQQNFTKQTREIFQYPTYVIRVYEIKLTVEIRPPTRLINFGKEATLLKYGKSREVFSRPLIHKTAKNHSPRDSDRAHFIMSYGFSKNVHFTSERFGMLRGVCV